MAARKRKLQPSFQVSTIHYLEQAISRIYYLYLGYTISQGKLSRVYHLYGVPSLAFTISGVYTLSSIYYFQSSLSKVYYCLNILSLAYTNSKVYYLWTTLLLGCTRPNKNRCAYLPMPIFMYPCLQFLFGSEKYFY